mgnify:CR=1 FL=1
MLPFCRLPWENPLLFFKFIILMNLHFTAINTLTNTSENFALFDDLTLQLILSSVTDDTRNHFLQKTISGLSTQDLDIIKVYFSEDMSLIRTCGKLYLHKNTLQYKLNRIHK